jgi:hypothetical protein
MPAPRQKSLFESATSRSRVVRHIDIACVIVDGGGAMIFPLQDFVQAQKWAASRMASGNVLSDRGRFFDRFLTVVSRPGSIVPTRGSHRHLGQIMRSMRAAGYDVDEWSFPAEVRHPPPMQPAQTKKGVEAPGPDEPDDAPGSAAGRKG